MRGRTLLLIEDFKVLAANCACRDELTIEIRRINYGIVRSTDELQPYTKAAKSVCAEQRTRISRCRLRMIVNFWLVKLLLCNLKYQNIIRLN